MEKIKYKIVDWLFGVDIGDLIYDLRNGNWDGVDSNIKFHKKFHKEILNKEDIYP